MAQRIEYIQIEPTTRCNYTCGFCAGRHMQQRDLAFTQFKELIDAIENLKHLELQGEGEPLLHPQFFEMIHYAKSRFPDVKISFITNGSLFTTENISRILECDIHTILISIESPNEDEFQKIRGGKLSKVKRGISDLIEKKLLINSPLKIGFAVTVLRQTVSQINDIGELYEKLGMNGGIVIQPLQAMDCYTQFYDAGMRQSIPNQDDRVQLNSLIATDNKLKQALMTHKIAKSFYSDLFSSVVPQSNACAWLENGLYISADGTANSCCFVKDSQKDGFSYIDDNLSQIIEQRSALSQKLTAGEMPNQCKSCGIAKNIIRQVNTRN